MLFTGNVLQLYPANTELASIVNHPAPEAKSITAFAPADDSTEITAKLFFNPDNWSSERLVALKETLYQLFKNFPLHLFIVYVQGTKFADDDNENDTTSKLIELWQCIDQFRHNSDVQIKGLGVCELSSSRLSSFLAAIEPLGLPKPVVNQINAEDCCALPPSLLKLAKASDIKLVGHHDPSTFGLEKPAGWILKLSRTVISRQILSSTEYLLNYD